MKLKKRMFKLHFRAEKESLQMDHLKRLTDHAIEVFLFVVIRNSGYNNGIFQNRFRFVDISFILYLNDCMWVVMHDR